MTLDPISPGLAINREVTLHENFLILPNPREFGNRISSRRPEIHDRHREDDEQQEQKDNPKRAVKFEERSFLLIEGNPWNLRVFPRGVISFG